MVINSDDDLEVENVPNTPQLPTEVIIHIMSYLSVADRMSAGLINRQWREASLDTQFVDRQVLVVNHHGSGDNLRKILNILQYSFRSFHHFVFKEIEIRRTVRFWEKIGSNMRSLILIQCDLGEKTLVDILKSCEDLRVLHINACRECLMSGRLLDDKNDIRILSEKFQNLKELSLASNRYLSDALFNKLVLICPNLESLSLMGCQISFHCGLYKKFYPNNSSVVQASESVLTFHNILRYIMQQAKRLKHLSFGYTLITGTALATLSTISELKLESLKLRACDQLTNVGIRAFTYYQTSLKVLDVSFCTRVTDVSLLCICKNLVNLESLNIRRCRAITDQGIRQIRCLRRLKELDMSECEQLTGECITGNLCSPTSDDCTALENGNHEHVDESENINPGAPNMLTSNTDTSANNDLEIFYANALNLDEKAIECIAMSFPKLRLLDVGYCFSAVTDQTIQMIFKKLTLLRILKISRCDKVSDVGLTGMGAASRENVEKSQMENIPECPKSKLRISLRSWAEEQIVRDANRKREVTKMCEGLSSSSKGEIYSGFSLTRLKGLRELDLVNCNRITDVSLKYAFTFPELKILDLSMCQQITYVGLDFLTRNNPAIEDLNLSRCHNVIDTGISYIAQRLRRLRRLHLQGCSQVTDCSLHSIKVYCNTLQYLDVRLCPKISIAGIEILDHLHVEYSKEREDFVSQSKIPPAPPLMRR